MDEPIEMDVDEILERIDEFLRSAITGEEREESE